MRTDFENWPGIAITAPQKCLGSTPGLSLLHVSDGAWRHIAANPNAPSRSALGSILDWRDAHRPGRAFRYAAGLRDLRPALGGCCSTWRKGGRTWNGRHRRAARAVQAGAAGPRPEPVGGRGRDQGRHRHRDRDAGGRGRSRGPRGGAGRIGGDAGRGTGRAEGARAADRAHGAGRVPAEPGDRADRARPHALRRLGAAADIGAGVEAALAAWDDDGGDGGTTGDEGAHLTWSRRAGDAP